MKRPPVAAKKNHAQRIHGHDIVDEYNWIRAENWREVMRDPSTLDAEIRTYLEQENDYTKAQMEDTEALQDMLFSEMKGRIKEDDSSVPTPDGDFEYLTRFETGAQYPLIVRTPRGGGAETIILNTPDRAEGKSYFRLGGASHTPDHKTLAWTADENGSEYFTARFYDIASETDLPDEITETSGSIVFAADSKTLFYVWLDENHRPARVYQTAIGETDKTPVLVYEEKDSGFFTGVGKTQSGDLIIIDSHDHTTSEIRILDAKNPTGEPHLVAKREAGIEYSLDHANDTLFILTNAEGAEDFKIVTAPVSQPGRDNWKDCVAHKPGRLILSHTVYKDFMIRLERENGLPRLVVRWHADGREDVIAFDEECYSLGFSSGYEFDTQSIRFTYSSMTTPSEVYDCDVVSGHRTLKKRQVVPSGHTPTDYVTRRLMAPAEDGELIPISILYKKNTPIDGTAPALLYGYGSYGMTIPAAFSTNALSLVDRGFIYAIAHIRGGKDKGYRWYTDGKAMKKKNTFTDFITAGRYLAKNKYTSEGQIIAEGGSAGGMLVGAVVNMAPSLFGGIIAAVPFVDVLNTMLDDSLPLTPPEWPEWGNPITDEKAFEYIKSYSPYDNIEPKEYPPILALAGLTDPRVTYWEPAKWVARLRATKTDDNLLALKTNMDAGHGGASGRFERLKEKAFSYAFALKVV